LGLHNWHQWAKPGAVIVVDEFQRIWPPRPNGSKVPADIEAMDTHRHMGVDFIFITQNLNNCDRHIHGLTNRHLHVRRVGNTPLCTIYEWDHASRALLFKNAFAKKPFRLRSSHFKLYTSAKLHTKQPRSLPAAIWFVLASAVGLAFMVPRIHDRLLPAAKAAPAVAQPAKAPAASASGVVPTHLDLMPKPSLPASAPIPLTPTPTRLTQLAGCVRLRDFCRCYDRQGEAIEAPPSACTAREVPRPALVVENGAEGGFAASGSAAADGDALAFMVRRSGGGRKQLMPAQF